MALSAFFAFASLFGILVNSKTIIAQIKNIYSENSGEVAGLNSLMSAVASNDIGGVRFFSKGGAALINQRNIGGATALHISCREKNFEIASLLIENGADVNVADNENWTPLMRASLAGADDIVELLLSKSADASVLNSVNESAITHAANSDCDHCLKLIFEKFNFIKLMDGDLLKSQINEAYTIARNHENQEIQSILEEYLDQIVKMSNLVTPSPVTSEDLGSISISEENKLDLVTKNNGKQSFGQNLPMDEGALRKKQISKIKGKFKFVGQDSSESEITNSADSDKYLTIEADGKPTKTSPTDAKITKSNKFVLISKGPKGEAKSEEKPAIKEFKPNDANDVFLRNSKIDNKPVTEILKSKKFKFSQGPASSNNIMTPAAPIKSDDKQTVKSSSKTDGNSDLAPIPPVVNSFKFLQGPKGQASIKKEGQGAVTTPSEKSLTNDEIKTITSSSEVVDVVIPKTESPEAAVKKTFKFSKGPSRQ